MPAIIPSTCHKQGRKTVLVLAILFSFILLWGSNAPVARADWFGLRDEPQLVSVSGELSYPDGIRVTIMIDGSERLLRGHQARAFLYLRSYADFDDANMRWHITDKYRAWKKGLQNSSSSNNPASGTYLRTLLHPDGTIRLQVQTVNTKKEGVEKVYFPDGQIRWITTYRNGKLDGP